MSDLSEIELKFVMSAEAAATLAADVMAKADSQDLSSTYFDTPQRDLQRAGATLRLRRTPDGWVQTLKAGGAGAVERFEDERPAPRGELDLDLFSQAGRARLPDLGERSLSALFETHVTRRTTPLSRQGSTIEAALDEGVIQAGAATEPIREFELELKAGDLDGLLAAAREIAAQPGVTLSFASKAERGYRLAAGEAAQAVKFQLPRLDPHGPATAAFQVLALAALHQLTANADLLRERPSLEAVHQARVALRRLRTYVGAFKTWTEDARLPAIQATLKRLTALFEDARALDVFELESFKPFARHEPGAAGFGHALLGARQDVYRKVQDAVCGQAYATDLFEVAQWVLNGPWLRVLSPAPGAGDTLVTAAHQLLAHRWRKLRRRGRRIDWRDPRARHKLRIQMKKMRYLTDAFEARGRHALKALKALQSDLGALNDIAVAPDAARLALAFAAPDVAFAAGAVVGERRAAVPRRIRAARRAFRTLARQERPRVG